MDTEMKGKASSIDSLSSMLGAGDTRHAMFPYDHWKTVCESGLFQWMTDTTIPKSSAIQKTIEGLEHLGEVCHDSGFTFSVVTHLASTITALAKFGSAELKARYMPQLLSGELIGAHAISEPAAGSDALSMATTAADHGDYFLLNGHKAFVTNGAVADVIVVYAKTSTQGTADSVSAFLLETASEGVELGPEIAKVGLHTSPLCELKLTNCKVAKQNMIGRLGAGFFILSHVMQREILFSFITNVGEMKRRLLRCVNYVNERNQFGVPIGSFQSVSNKIADMKIRYELSRQWLYHIASLMGANKDITSEIAIAKVFVSENALATSIDALHLHGGYGYVAANGLGEEVCNALAGPIYSGTNDIQRGRIASMLGVATQRKTRFSAGQPANDKTLAPTDLQPAEKGGGQVSELFDYHHAEIQKFVRAAVGEQPVDDRDIAVRLYYAVRDQINYEVFATDISAQGLKASSIVQNRKGFCLHKSILYAAACRSRGIPCRIIASKVTNHIASPELKELVGGDVFLHWYNEVKINGTWLQVAPVFNKLLCKLYNLQPLEFDGFNSSLHQQYNSQSTMQYIGSAQKFDEPTHEEIIQLVREFHPNMVTELQIVPDFSNGNRMAACSAAGACS
jgi:alkylation response protein AidB-like acyl-CoA dehydrogenase